MKKPRSVNNPGKRTAAIEQATIPMAEKREIDERDIDRLLSALSDSQIAELYGMSEAEVSQLRRERKLKSRGPSVRNLK